MKHVVQYSILDILNMRKGEMLGIPAKSRHAGSRWTKEDRQLFIDSVLNGITLPMFYLYMCLTKEREFLYNVEDGKERLTAIADFYEGELPLSEGFRFMNGSALAEKLGTDGHELAGMCYDDISMKYPIVAGTFLNGSIDCTVFDEDDRENVAETFRRQALKCGSRTYGDSTAVNPEDYSRVTGILLDAVELLMKISPENQNSLKDVAAQLGTSVQELEGLGVLTQSAE